MTSKTDAVRLVVLLDTIKRERERRSVDKTPLPVTKSASVKPATQLASGSPAVVDHYRANLGGAYLDVLLGGFSQIMLIDSARHESGPNLTGSDTLPHEMLRDSTGRRNITAPEPQPEPDPDA